MTVIGDVQGKNVVLVDDMVDTAGTLDQGGRHDDGAGRHQCACRVHPRRS